MGRITPKTSISPEPTPGSSPVVSHKPRQVRQDSISSDARAEAIDQLRTDLYDTQSLVSRIVLQPEPRVPIDFEALEARAEGPRFLDDLGRTCATELKLRGLPIASRMPIIDDFLARPRLERQKRFAEMIQLMSDSSIDTSEFFTYYSVSSLISMADQCRPKGASVANLASPQVFGGGNIVPYDLRFNKDDLESPGYQALKEALIEDAEIEEEALEYLYGLHARFIVLQYASMPRNEWAEVVGDELTIRASEDLVCVFMYKSKNDVIEEHFPKKIITIKSHKRLDAETRTPWWQIMLFLIYFGLMIYMIPVAYEGYLHRHDH